MQDLIYKPFLVLMYLWKKQISVFHLILNGSKINMSSMKDNMYLYYVFTKSIFLSESAAFGGLKKEELLATVQKSKHLLDQTLHCCLS